MSTIEEVVARQRRALLQDDDPMLSQLAGDYRRAIAELEARALSAAQRAADIAAAGGDPVVALIELGRLQELQRQVEIQLGAVSRRGPRLIAERQRVAVVSALRDASGMALEVGVRLNVPAVERMVAALAGESPLALLFAPLAPAAARTVRERLVQGVILGQNPRVTARRIALALNGNGARALTIARTETLRAYRGAIQDTYRQNARLLGGWVWVAACDRRTCGVCFAMHGTRHPLEEPFGSHPNCIPAGAVVAGPRVVASTARWWEGDLVEIETAKGNSLSVTPNHPVLTSNGWVAANDLREGGYVISGSFPERPFPAVDPDDYHVPTLIEDVAIAARRALGVPVVTVPTAAEDFHGDGRGSKVHVVWPNRELCTGLDAALPEPDFHELLSRGDTYTTVLPRGGTTTALVPRLTAASTGLMRGHSPEAVLFRCFVSRDEYVRFGRGPALDSSLLQSAYDSRARDAQRIRNSEFTLPACVAANDLVNVDLDEWPVISQFKTTTGNRSSHNAFVDPEPSREALSRFASEVGIDQIVSIKRRRFSGHVYNLQTIGGWYSANGIITHNCRCSPAPLPRTMPPAIAGGAERFDELPERDQLVVLGPAKLKAYQQNLITLDDLVGLAEHPRWGLVRYERSLTSILGPQARELYRSAA